MVIAVKRRGVPRFASVEFDDYIPLAVDWVAVGSVRPVYCRIKSSDGGDIELKIEPLTGELIGVVVIESPVHLTSVPEVLYDTTALKAASIFVDLAEWQPNPDGVPTREVVYETGDLAWAEDDTAMYFSWSPDRPAEFVMGGRAGFGLALDGTTVTGVVARK